MGWKTHCRKPGAGSVSPDSVFAFHGELSKVLIGNGAQLQ